MNMHASFQHVGWIYMQSCAPVQGDIFFSARVHYIRIVIFVCIIILNSFEF